MRLYKIVYIPALLILLSGLYSCDGIFPTASKQGIPDDHQSNFGGFLHKGGKDDANPDECDDCHTLDLQGKVSKVNGVYRWAPSCYQCHGNKWDKRNDKVYY